MSKYTVVADSGSTKTDWVVVEEGGYVSDRIKTMGFNPYFQSSEFIFNEVQKAYEASKTNPELVGSVYFYGAGCSSDEKRMIVRNALTAVFPKAEIYVDHDLVAASVASLGDEEGIACIIGTGANSCVWQNGEVVHNIPSHGYIFGDEGSGSYLGIRLVKRYLEGSLSDELTEAFEKEFKLSKDQILNATYKEKDPNVFLAHFAVFYRHQIHHQCLTDILYQGFDEFFQKRVIPYPDYKNYELGFVGSIAYFYKEILGLVADKYDIKIRKICQCPIDELVKYHTGVKVLKAV